MPIYVDKLPQDIEPVGTIITIEELIQVLPETLDYPLNVWLSDKIAYFGKTNGNFVFLADGIGEPTTELREYFNSLVVPINKQATLSYNWKNNNKNFAVKIYNDGRLIIDKNTMTYKELPSVIQQSPFITVDDVMSKLPNNIEWKYTIYLTGGIVRNGYSGKDVDFIIFEDIDASTLSTIKRCFTEKMGWFADVGTFVFTDKEPVYLYKIYENGLLCQI